MKNNTLHKNLKEVQDLWIDAELNLLEHKLICADSAVDAIKQAPENRDQLRHYLNVDLRGMLTKLKKTIDRVDNQRRNIMTQFPATRVNRS